MALRPKSTDVIVIPIEDPDMTDSGIILTAAKQLPDQGVIKYRGSAVTDFLVGDHVIFSPYSGSKVVTSDEGHLIVLPASEVLAKIDHDLPTQLVIPRDEVILRIRTYRLLTTDPATLSLFDEMIEDFTNYHRHSTEF